MLILGKVRHSYAASNPPLWPWVLVRSNGAVLVAHCTSMAGLAETYSRVGAILHGVETALRVRNDTPCTSKENKWLLPPPLQQIPYLQLCDIDFTAPKRHCAPTASPSVNSSMTAKIASPSQTEIQHFFSSIAKEQHKKKTIILSVIQPYSDGFACSSDHLPLLLQGLFMRAYLE